MKRPRALTDSTPAVTILVADDEKNIRLTVAEALADFDAEVLTAVSGEDALDRMEEQAVDILLLDLAMPGLDGLEVLQRATDEHPDVRVVIITAHGTVEKAVEAMKLGAIDFIQKPFAPDEIREVVLTAMDERSGGGQQE